MRTTLTRQRMCGVCSHPKIDHGYGTGGMYCLPCLRSYGPDARHQFVEKESA